MSQQIENGAHGQPCSLNDQLPNPNFGIPRDTLKKLLFRHRFVSRVDHISNGFLNARLLLCCTETARV